MLLYKQPLTFAPSERLPTVGAVFELMRSCVLGGAGIFNYLSDEHCRGFMYESVPVDEYSYHTFIHVLLDEENMMLLLCRADLLWRPDMLFENPNWSRTIQSESSLIR